MALFIARVYIHECGECDIMSASDWIAVAGIIATPVIGFVIWLVSISNRVGKLETKVEIFWKLVSLDAAKVLHSPHPERERLDQLIEAYVAGSITKSENVEMIAILQEIINNSLAPCGERLAASTLMHVLEFQLS